MESLFRDYWWLLFPIFGMAMGFFSIFSYFNHKNETLKMITVAVAIMAIAIATHIAAYLCLAVWPQGLAILAM